MDKTPPGPALPEDVVERSIARYRSPQITNRERYLDLNVLGLSDISEMYSKILIANRGAIARRIVRACHDLSIGSAVVFTEPDQDAILFRGWRSSFDRRSIDSYMNTEQLLKVAKEVGADAIHPGYGFLSENADFAKQVRAAGMHFIGPSPDWIERMAEIRRARN